METGQAMFSCWGVRTPRTAHSLLMAGFWLLAALIVMGRYGLGIWGWIWCLSPILPLSKHPNSTWVWGKPFREPG